MHVIDTPDGALLIDTVARLRPTWCAGIRALGYTGVLRYLGGLTERERDGILGAGLGLVPIQYGGTQGRWIPSAVEGEQRGRDAVRAWRALNLPDASPLVCDAESPNPTHAGKPVLAYLRGWSKVVVAAGCQPVLYVGPGLGLSAEQLWSLPDFKRYFKSMSHVPPVARRGYCLEQYLPAESGHFPGVEVIRKPGRMATARLNGVPVDVDVATADRLGCRLPMIVRG